MRTLILFVGTAALIGCANADSAVTASRPRELKVEVDEVSAELHDCPEELSGYIQGRVVSPDLDAPVHVMFLMSNDATVDVLAAPDGSFEIPCVYPAPSYEVCVVSRGARSCGRVAGPQAIGLRLSTSGPGG